MLYSTASFLFSSSSSSSERNGDDYVTPPVKKNHVSRKLFVDDVDIDNYYSSVHKRRVNYNVHKDKMNVDDVGGEKNDGGKGKNKIIISDGDDEKDEKFGMGKNDDEGDEDIRMEKIDDEKDVRMGKNVDDEDSRMGKNDDDEDIGNQNYDFTFADVNKVVPCVGMIFDTLDEEESFYRNYGRNVGFEIIIRNTHKHQRSHDPSSRLFICKKGGRVAPESDYRDKGKRRIRDVDPRTKCRARMYVCHLVNVNKWKVTLVDLKHNHAMVTPDKRQFFQTSRNIDPIIRSLIELFNKSGIETSKVMKYLGETCGGIENLRFSNQDVRHTGYSAPSV